MEIGNCETCKFDKTVCKICRYEPLLSHAVLGEGWRDARKEFPIKCKKIIVAMTNGADTWVRESEFDSYTNCFMDNIMNDIESIDVDGNKLTWVYAWMPLPDPPTVI